MHNAPPRFHIWNDDDKMLLAVGPTMSGLYGYSAAGDRPYKITGPCNVSSLNGGVLTYEIFFDNAVLYPNPYITVTPNGYFKHYFAGTERIATAIGGGGFCNMIVPTDNLTNTEQVRKHEILKYLSSYLSDQTEDHTNNEDIAHNLLPKLQYSDARQTLHNISYNIYLRTSLCTTLNELCNKQKDDVVFYYHPDHLGGAAWITDMSGKPVQYLHYAPYGELVANQMPYGIDERFKFDTGGVAKLRGMELQMRAFTPFAVVFTGKERDAETGYDNFEARPYISAFSIFGKVDPLLDKNIHENPYFYCSGNPIKYIDPDGNEKHNKMDPNSEDINQCHLFEAAVLLPEYGDGTTHIFFIAHGSQTEMNPYDSEKPMTAEDFVLYLSNNSDLWKNTEDKSLLTIVLVSCSTGKGENPIAKQISKLLPETTIIAPTEDVLTFSIGEDTTIGGCGKNSAKTIKELGLPEYLGHWKSYRNEEVISVSKDGFMYNLYPRTAESPDVNEKL